jgi:uncharacterized membrane protein
MAFGQPRRGCACEAPSDTARGSADAVGRFTMTYYLLLRYLHVLGAIVLLGTGVGIAFFNGHGTSVGRCRSHRPDGGDRRPGGRSVHGNRRGRPASIGSLLLHETGVPVTQGWVLASVVLYGIAGAFWIPVVWMQARMRDLASEAATSGRPLPARYRGLYRLWFLFGFLGFGSVLAILWLMVAKPSF